jgi:hypothetical protein
MGLTNDTIQAHDYRTANAKKFSKKRQITNCFTNRPTYSLQRFYVYRIV